MTKHLFGAILTHYGTAANNRGENEGNITTLQKLLWQGEVHTTVSAEAIRYAIRQYWQQTLGAEHLNRHWDESGEEKPSHLWRDHSFSEWERFLDDDVVGFMAAEAAKAETNPAEGGKKAKGTTRIRRARLEVCRAISLTPFEGDITFNAASVGATPSASKTGKNPVPYGTELHATYYQYGFALTPGQLADPTRARHVVDALVDLRQVAGNHARFLYDFSPETVVFRWTEDFSPRLLYSFAEQGEAGPGTPSLIQRVESGDVDAKELVIGGGLALRADGQHLKEAGAMVLPGVKAAAKEIKARLAQQGPSAQAA